MAQHDYMIANQIPAAFRADLNNALAAIVSNNSGPNEPNPTYAYQFWADTTTGLLKQRNAANNAWVSLFRLDGTFSSVPPANGAVTTAKLADGAVTAAKASVASQTQAEAGTNTTTLMTPQRVAQAIAALAQLADGAVTNVKVAANAGIVDSKLTGTTCKAWVNFNGTGTVAIRASYNVSSITDNGVGDYTVNFTTALADANYAVITGATGAWATNNTARSIGISSTTAPTASAVRIVNIGTGGAEDTSYQQIAIFR